MLRAATKQQLYNALDDTYFGAANFHIEYGDGKPLWVRVSFVPNDTFVLSVERAQLGTGFFQVSEAPGLKLLRADRRLTETFEQAIKSIPSWVTRIKEEVIDSNPINREIQLVRGQLNERIDLLAEKQEEFFTQAEADELHARLNAFSQKLNELAESNSDLNDTVASLKAKLEELATATMALNKGTWLRMASSKLLSATKAIIGSKEAREFALDAAKRILLEGPK